MSYLLKCTGSQGVVGVKLTDAGRKKLSEGRLNIELFQLGDSEFCYDCYTTLPNDPGGSNISIISPMNNAQNLNPIPEKNKAHVKYPIPRGRKEDGNGDEIDSFGPVTADHTLEEIFNRARPRGFFTGNTSADTCSCSYSAFTGTGYTLNSNWTAPYTGLTGGTQLIIQSGVTCNEEKVHGVDYSPKVGDLVAIYYNFTSGCTAQFVDSTPERGSCTNCSEIPCILPAATLFYEVQGGNLNTGQTSTELILTVDRDLPNMTAFTMGVQGNQVNAAQDTVYTAFTGTSLQVKIFPSFTGCTPMLEYYGMDTPIPYWSEGSLSFDNNCDVSVADVNIWNMNINWTAQVAGVNSLTGPYESVNFYGSSGYCGTKEYLGYNSNDGQTDTGSALGVDYYNGTSSSSFYTDSFKRIRAVLPDDQKCISILHYTNETISNFYGEKLAMKKGTGSEIGDARNFKLVMPTLMWHKKYAGGTGRGNENMYGQCFYVDPPGYSVFPGQPYVMQSTPNSNMNDDGLRYYFLYDDNQSPSVDPSGSTLVGPNVVGKVFPDLKMVVIHDEELIAAMSYKSNRNWTLPAPRVTKIQAGSNCIGSASTNGVFTLPNQTLYLSYLFTSASGLSTSMHCNYYIPVDSEEYPVDLEIEFGPEFPYLRPYYQELTLKDGVGTNLSGGTGWHADKLHLIWQVVTGDNELQPHLWNKTEVTEQITNHAVNTQLHGSAITQTTQKFYLTAANADTGSTYNYTDYVALPSATTQSSLLQFGDEYFYYGDLQSDIMATIYQMRYQVNLPSTQYVKTSTNPTYQSYLNANPGMDIDTRITEIGLFDNSDGFPDLMAIAKFKDPKIRTGPQTFTLSLDF
tara:strand:- start:848 stop:3403 length:2556 start_codon:yes stop_codon:yes gene_type:complete